MIYLSIILAGATAIAAQIIYLRQFLIVFYGNELSISFILASWLISTAIGSALLPSLRGVRHWYSGGRRSNLTIFSYCQISLGVLLIAGIVAIKFIKPFLGVNPGQIIPLFPITAISFAILAPICILVGFMFPLACHIRAGIGTTGTGSGTGLQPRLGEDIGSVYILEAIGSIIGGVLTSYVFIQLFSAFHIVAIFACLNFFAALLLSWKNGDTHFSALKHCIKMGVPIFLIFALWYSGGFEKIEKNCLKREWQGYEVIASRNSIYGNILITKRGETYSLFNNGLHLFTIPDRAVAEDAIHLTLLEHPDPKDILLIGGGAGGLIEEILKHPVKRVDYVELDPLIIRLSEEYLPESYYKALKDPRVSIKNIDGRFFVKNAKDKYDCVILHTGDPYTAEGNRYYTAEFFGEVKRALKDGGIVSFALASSESYISKPLAEFLRSVYATLKSVFSAVIIMPGETAYFLATDSANRLTYDYRILEERTKERALDTQYVRDYYLSYKLSPEKIAYSKKVIEGGEGSIINHDSKPASYYYGLIFWTTLFKDSAFSNILKMVTEPFIWRLIGIFIILFVVIPALYRRSFKRTALVAIMAGGFSNMAFQILILLSFQAMYGYLFYKLGIIITAFMAGLALGAFFVMKVVSKMKRDRIFLLAAQGDFILFSIILSVILSNQCSASLFPVLSIIAGSIGGAQFVLANNIVLGEREDAGKVGGLSYGLDLFGSFFGTLLTGVFLIPILGIPKTCFAIALINVAVLALLIINMRVEE